MASYRSAGAGKWLTRWHLLNLHLFPLTIFHWGKQEKKKLRLWQIPKNFKLGSNFERVKQTNDES
jgi:hypothetical protein